MAEVKMLPEWMADQGRTLGELIELSHLDGKVVEAIAAGRYTPSPEQRRKIATALGLAPEQIVWGHLAPVEHVYGHGPQFGRSP
jgi:hypothetical protein